MSQIRRRGALGSYSGEYGGPAGIAGWEWTVNNSINNTSELYQRRASGIRFGSTSLRHRDVTILAESKDAGIIPLVESHSERESER